MRTRPSSATATGSRAGGGRFRRRRPAAPRSLLRRSFFVLGTHRRDRQMREAELAERIHRRDDGLMRRHRVSAQDHLTLAVAAGDARYRILERIDGGIEYFAIVDVVMTFGVNEHDQ